MMFEMSNIMFEMNNRDERIHKLVRRYTPLALGVTVCLIGAFLMAWGEPVLGYSHTGIARVIGILGIGIIARTRIGMEN